MSVSTVPAGPSTMVRVSEAAGMGRTSIFMGRD
jgi:hypothetical protein